MVQVFTVWAAAGCGKTTFCTRMIERLVENGDCAKEQILYSTFAREAAADAAIRIGLTSEERRQMWFRTLHSVCFRLLGVRKGQVVTPQKLREFGTQMGVEINADLAVEEDEAADLAKVILAMERVKTSSEDSGAAISGILAMYQHSRLTAANAQELLAARYEPSPSALAHFGGKDWSRYPDVVEEYQNWKGTELYDFVDMLEMVLLRPIPLPRWKFVFIDECQDLSQLQWAVVDRLSQVAQSAYYVGDDYQAIMSFQGASAESFLSRRRQPGSFRLALPTTHRFGDNIIELGRRIVEGLPDSEGRVIYPARPVHNPIRRIWDVSEAEDVPGSKLWLHRHKDGCNALANHCIMNGIPFWSERGVNPLAKGVEIAGFKAISRLVRGEYLDGSEAGDMAKVLRATKDGVKLVKRGSIGKLEAMEAGRSFSPMDIVSAHFTDELWNALRAGDWSVTDIRFATYYQAIAEAGWELGGDVAPDITITTIHGSKGRDAESVLLWDETLPKCLRDPNERRVAYVAATRTKGPLYIVSSPVTNWRTENYPYPIEGISS